MVWSEKTVSDWYAPKVSEPALDPILSQKYHAVYMRRWRKTHPLTPQQRKKDNARSYAGVYKRRGRLVPETCICGETDVEMHHEDYDRPIDVTWLCRECHLTFHKKQTGVT